MTQLTAFRNDILFFKGAAYHRSSTMAFCEGEVRDSSDRLIAKSMGTFKYLKQ